MPPKNNIKQRPWLFKTTPLTKEKYLVLAELIYAFRITLITNKWSLKRRYFNSNHAL